MSKAELAIQVTDTAIPVALPTEVNPIATIKGQAVIDLPKDLYIPPDAMKVLLETFEGPLDLLLYLIRKQNIDILDIPIAAVTKQYIQYIDLMQSLSLELIAEYLVMAAILAEIKSRMLLPRVADLEEGEEDPRAELVRRLQEYEQFKKAAADMDLLSREERDIFLLQVDSSELSLEKPKPEVDLKELLYALLEVIKRAELSKHHQIQLEALSIREKMSYILQAIEQKEHQLFSQLFKLTEGRLGIVVTFLAMLELLKQGLIEFVQTAPFAPIYLSKKSASEK